MTKSAFVEVNITNPTRLAQDSQDTANNAVKGVTDLNDPNLMSVIEKQNNIGQFAGLTSQYNVLVQNAKDDGIDTTAVTTAYNNLNRFMADILADSDHASDVDRVTYKKYQDAYNEELAKLQTALQNNTNDKFTSAASALSQAASTANVAKSAADSTYAYANSEIAVQSTATAKAQSVADNAFSQAQAVGSQASVEISKNSMATAKAQSAADNAFNKAQEVGSQASSEIAVQSNATAKAQSTADSAFSQAVTAIDTGKATSQAVTALKDGSTLTIAQLGNGLASKVSNSEYASYKEQTASQIGQMVTNGAFSAYQQTTADLISAKVATKDFTAYQATTAKSIDSKVESSDFNTYKTQTANLISEKVSNSEYASNKEQTASQIADRVSNSAFSTYQEQTASQFASKVDNGDFTTYKTQTADLISARVATKDFKAYQDTTAKAISSKVESNDFNTYKTQTANLINDKVSSAKYTSDKTQTDKDIASKVSSDDFSTYKTQTNELIGSKVSNGDFSTYKTQTAGLISAKVETKDFSSYKDETAKAISSKVESKDFNTYKTQTADAISSKVSNIDFNNLKISNRNLALGTTTPIKIVGQNINNQAQVGYSFSKVIPRGTLVTATFDVSSSTGVGNLTMQFFGSDSGSSWQTIYAGALVKGTKHVSATITTDGDHLHIYPRLDNATGDVVFSNFIISESSKEVGWTPAPEDLATQSQITQLSGDINLRVTKKGLLDEINLQAGNTLISSSGQLTLSGKNILLDSNDPVIMKSANIDTLLVGKKLTAADISANTFTTNNGTFTVDKNGLVTATSLIIRGSTNLVYNASLSGGNGSYIPGWNMNGEGYYSNATLYDGVPALVWNSTAASGVWDNYATTYYQSVTQTGIPYSASGTFRDYGSTSGMMFQCTLAFFTDKNTGSRINGYKSFNHTATGGDSGNIYFTIDNVVAPSNAKYVALQFWAYNGKGHAAWSQPMLTQTAKATGYQPDTGNIISAGTVIGTNISASIINGTTINAGDINNNGNNTARFYPLTIDSSGSIRSYHIDSYFASSAKLYTGNLIISNRNMNANAGSNKFGGETAVLGGSSLTLSSGYTEGKDTDFTKPLVSEDQPGTTKLILSGITGITLKGDDQKIHFHGMYSDKQPKGITFTPYGNINGDEGSTTGNWYVGYNLANMTAQFGIDNLKKNTIEFYRPTFVDEIGALGGLSNGRLLLHAVDGNAQMYLLNDGSPAVTSPTVYNRTYSDGANMYVTSYGRIGRSTSASKYKLAIARSDDTLQADRLMTLKPASWNDKVATEKMAESLSNGEIPVEEEINLRRHYGLIAEDLRDAGLDEFLITGKDGQIEGIEYDRLWTVLIPKIKQLNNRINELERKTL